MATRHDNFRFKCRNPKCNYESTVRRISLEDFEATQYRGGYPCEVCGFPKMAVMRSNKIAKDGFIAGYQRVFNDYAWTYSEYKRKLKEHGLIEIGYEELDHSSEDGKSIDYWDDEIAKELYEQGIRLDENMIKYLKQMNDEIYKKV